LQSTHGASNTIRIPKLEIPENHRIDRRRAAHGRPLRVDPV